MSKNQFLITFLAIGIFATAVGTLLLKEKNQQRGPASLVIGHASTVAFPSENTNYKKIKMIQGKFNDHRRSKMKGAVQISLELLEDYQVDAPFRMKAYIRSNKAIDVIEYQWVPGPGVSVFTGAKGSAIYNIDPENPQELEVTLLKKEDGLPARVFLQISYQEDGRTLGQSAYFSSKYQTEANLAQQKLKHPDTPDIPAGLKVIY